MKYDTVKMYLCHSNFFQRDDSMIVEFIYNMALVIMFILLSLRIKEHIMKSNNTKPYHYKVAISLIAILIIKILMQRPFIYKGISFDLKSVPLLLISYIYGWKYGVLAASLPAVYRYFLGGKAVLGAIFLEIFLAVIIGSLFHQKHDSENIIVSVNKKRVFKAYTLLLLIGFGLYHLFYDYSFYFWVKIVLTFSFFSLFTLLFSVVIINESNQSIHKNTVEYDNLQENYLSNKSKLKKVRNKIDFIGKLSHEFKTPLNLVFSAVQMIKLYNGNRENESQKKISKYIKVITQNGYRMLRLVNNLIDLVKMDSDSFTLKYKNVDIVELLKEVTFSVKGYVDCKKRKIEFNSEIDYKVIKCDPINVERIMLNLLSNALKFTEEGDRIIVNLKEDNNNIKFSVKDEGIGIKNENIKQIFEEFNQIDESMVRNSEGSGLGLSIVKSLVDMHGGRIEVESEYGEGTEFIVILPDERINGKETQEVAFNDTFDRTAIEFSDLSL